MASTPMEKASTLYRNTYNSIAGVDIKAVFFGVTFGNLQAISYSITREKAPVYTMGSPEVRGYARGKRAIAGNMVFVMFDDHALLGALRNIAKKQERPEGFNYFFVSDFDEIRPMTSDLLDLAVDPQGFKGSNNGNYLEIQKQLAVNLGTTDYAAQAYNTEELTGATHEENWSKAMPWYSDQIPSFNIVLTGVNEDGFAATMSILGVEILNEGYGISIDDLISEQQMTYVARAIARWRKAPNTLHTNKSASLNGTITSLNASAI